LARFRRSHKEDLWTEEVGGVGPGDRGAWTLLSVYADTSFFVSLYIPDRHSHVARALVADQQRLWLTSLHRAEWTHAVAQHVFRKVISPREAQQVYREFERDRKNAVWEEVAFPEMAFESCMRLARRHGARLGTRTLDTLHVAVAIEFKASAFWTFDERQSRLAKTAGLTVP
jgi:predicted nucleic acid-binding protein